ncbi:hypothetical protein OH77DRAFT_283081 [Trametes cingulata]|nr:hypothetical protein OH77DRAFT_283081 [Trametes cingulata]
MDMPSNRCKYCSALAKQRRSPPFCASTPMDNKTKQLPHLACQDICWNNSTRTTTTSCALQLRLLAAFSELPRLGRRSIGASVYQHTTERRANHQCEKGSTARRRPNSTQPTVKAGRPGWASPRVALLTLVLLASRVESPSPAPFVSEDRLIDLLFAQHGPCC